ncbi:MAG: hypothetical protein JEY91_03460 [Spirochaetaceae bacterium]|nr:hypothetical protein [Spirochaetaceae bacterium]
MKGKQLIDKIIQPAVIFATGVLVVSLLIANFVFLHVTTVYWVDEINQSFDEINHLIYQNLMDDDLTSEKMEVLRRHINSLLDSDTLNKLFSTYEEIDGESFKFEIRGKEDLNKLYNLVHRVLNIVHEQSLVREKTFRVIYLFIFVTIISMILFLGISQYENYKVLRYEKIRNETNNKLYDQLEKERSLIAFELHDDIAQKLAIIKRYFKSKNTIDEHTELMENYASDVIKRVRYLSRMLKAPDNPDVSFKDYLETLFSDFNVLSDFKLNRKTVGLNALKLNPSAALHIYRIIQEILTNSRIHSEATEIDLLLVYSHPTLNIKYKDNGKGFDPYLVYRKGIGLESIKYRLDILRGEYTLNSLEGEGTDISIDIPVELCEISL